MNKPRVLVMTAAGKTGMPVALQLLSEGFPLTALVRREDHRSEYLRSKGADIVVGSITDLSDMQRAMAGVQRAYFCVPLEPGNLKAAAVFMAVAAQAESKLESLVVMSQWLANPYHPSVQTRETWLADRLFALLPTTAVTTINVGFFADNDMQTLAFAAQFGRLMLPYGSGLNAPPSNEDIARVIAEILARPEGHAGKSYRPTGPKLLSTNDMAAILTKVLGHSVKFVEAPNWMMSKVMKGMGFSDYSIAQIQQYTLDYQKGAFALNAPTEVVRRITGREPEDFETIARRYLSAKPNMKRNLVSQLKLMVLTLVSAISQWPRPKRYLAGGDFSDQQRLSLSAESAEWYASHASGQPTDPILV
jgi:NAD(P)H dehydrogenase (quinone)